jgi:hypothetical protein
MTDVTFRGWLDAADRKRTAFAGDTDAAVVRVATAGSRIVSASLKASVQG